MAELPVGFASQRNNNIPEKFNNPIEIHVGAPGKEFIDNKNDEEQVSKSKEQDEKVPVKEKDLIDNEKEETNEEERIAKLQRRLMRP